MAEASGEAALEPAFVLHSWAYRNTSLLLELLTRGHGRIGLVARGARGPRSRTAGLLQPFQPLAVSWRTRGELGNLRQVEGAGRPLRLIGRRLVSGFYANELLLRLLGRDDPHPGLFECYVGFLDALTAEADEAVALRTFERDLLALLGYGLALERDTDNHRLAPDQWYRYDPAQGAMAVGGPQAGGLVLSGRLLLALGEDPISAETARQSRDLMRAALRPHIGERPLKSRELYARYPATGGHENGASSGQS